MQSKSDLRKGDRTVKKTHKILKSPMLAKTSKVSSHSKLPSCKSENPTRRKINSKIHAKPQENEDSKEYDTVIIEEEYLPDSSKPFAHANSSS